MADEGGKTFPSPCDSVSQSAPCFSLPSIKSNGDTEYGSEFPMSCFLAIFLEDCKNVLFYNSSPTPQIKTLGRTLYKKQCERFQTSQ